MTTLTSAPLAPLLDRLFAEADDADAASRRRRRRSFAPRSGRG